MIRTVLIIACIAAVASPVLAQDALQIIQRPRASQILKDALKATPPPLQSLITVDAPVSRGPATRVKNGVVLAVQTIRPAPGVTLEAAPHKQPRYGAAGDVLFPVVDDGAVQYCRREPNPRKLSSPRHRNDAKGKLHCFSDPDGDGRFDLMSETYLNQALIGGSHFLVKWLAAPKPLAAPVPYARSGAVAPYAEQIGIRYGGVLRGFPEADGGVRGALVMVALSIRGDSAPARDDIGYAIGLPDGESGVVELPTGHSLTLGAATMEDIQVEVTSALPAGETLLFPGSQGREPVQ
ncbi:hypothetical protein [Caulobacter endophyticus]|uniref:Uncharacterized protein n=1 Tax=Caulobacter endophyticus TaxID=2172652 RepID=A0A2T9JJA8_9CAUL|nr:hypothetical protein [Caulobacter endophyticus]PVM83777.1 hypothetical protein DDF67_20105 [Caulobacter endophyticus]